MAQGDLFAGTATTKRKRTARKPRASKASKPRASKPRKSKARTTADTVLSVNAYKRRRGKLPGRHPKGSKVANRKVGGRFKRGKP